MSKQGEAFGAPVLAVLEELFLLLGEIEGQPADEPKAKEEKCDANDV